MVAMVSGEESNEEEVRTVEARVNEWIEALPPQHPNVSCLLFFSMGVVMGQSLECFDSETRIDREVPHVDLPPFGLVRNQTCLVL
jgi:hypothetical protein